MVVLFDGRFKKKLKQACYLGLKMKFYQKSFNFKPTKRGANMLH